MAIMSRKKWKGFAAVAGLGAAVMFIRSRRRGPDRGDALSKEFLSRLKETATGLQSWARPMAASDLIAEDRERQRSEPTGAS